MKLSVIGVLLLISHSIANQKDNTDLQVVNATAKFANEFYKILSREEGNILFSPFAIHIGLSMLFQRADGGAGKVFSNLTKLSEPAIAQTGYGKIIPSLRAVQNVSISIVNKAYIDAAKAYKANFYLLAKENFSYDIEPGDFAESQSKVKQINEWVQAESKGRIPQLLTEDELQHAILVLANSISFNATWRTPFKLGFKDQYHTDAKNNKTNATLMHNTARYYYKYDKALNAEILELPFSNINFGLIVILPKEKNGTADLEVRLSKVNLNEITIGSTERRIRVSLPKFQFGQSVDLVAILTEMGYGELFDASCNLDYILEKPEDLHVTSALQKAFIKVDEAGTEATAAGAIRGTGSNFTTSTAPTVDFRADRPFIYMLTHQNVEIPGSRHVLYFGRMHHPSFD